MSNIVQPLRYSFDEAGPSFSDKGKAREVLCSTPAPPWYNPADDSEQAKLEGGWWGYAAKDESYTSGLPAVPVMATPYLDGPPTPRRRVRRKSPIVNGESSYSHSSATLVDEPSSSILPPKHPRTKSRQVIQLETVVHRSVDKLFEARQVVNRIQEWQKAETEGGILPPKLNEQVIMERERSEEKERRRIRRDEGKHARKRRKLGGEVGEEEAAVGMKRATASMLAHAGFDGESRCISFPSTLMSYQLGSSARRPPADRQGQMKSLWTCAPEWSLTTCIT
jgi:transcriptional activator SPT7